MALEAFFADPDDVIAPNGGPVLDYCNGTDGQDAGADGTASAHGGLDFAVDGGAVNNVNDDLRDLEGFVLTIGEGIDHSLIDIGRTIGGDIGSAFYDAAGAVHDATWDLAEEIFQLTTDHAPPAPPPGPDDVAPPNPYGDPDYGPGDYNGPGGGDTGGGDTVIAFNGGPGSGGDSGGSGSGGGDSGGSGSGGGDSGGSGSGGGDSGGGGSGGGDSGGSGSGGGDSGGSGSGGGDSGGSGSGGGDSGGSGEGMGNPDGNDGTPSGVPGHSPGNGAYDGGEADGASAGSGGHIPFHDPGVGQDDGDDGDTGGSSHGAGSGDAGATQVSVTGIALDGTGIDGENGTANTTVSWLNPGIYMNGADPGHAGAATSFVSPGHVEVTFIAGATLDSAHNHGSDFWAQAAEAVHLGTTATPTQFTGAEFTPAATATALASLDHGHSTFDTGALDHGLDTSALTAIPHTGTGDTLTHFELPELHTGFATQLHL